MPFTQRTSIVPRSNTHEEDFGRESTEAEDYCGRVVSDLRLQAMVTGMLVASALIFRLSRRMRGQGFSDQS